MHNIVRENAGPVREVICHSTSPMETFYCFITPDMVATIVNYTNEEGHRILGDQWQGTSVGEIQTYFGLLLLAGVYRGHLEPIIHLWNKENGRPIFGKAMSRNRFQTIMRFLRFDNKDTCLAHCERDKLAPL